MNEYTWGNKKENEKMKMYIDWSKVKCIFLKKDIAIKNYIQDEHKINHSEALIGNNITKSNVSKSKIEVNYEEIWKLYIDELEVMQGKYKDVESNYLYLKEEFNNYISELNTEK